MEFAEGSRAILAADVPVLNNSIIKAGTPCAVASFVNNDIAIVRYGFENERELIAGVPVSLLKEGKYEDFNKIPSYYLLPKKYSVGERFVSMLSTVYGIGKGDIVTILEVILSHEHESKDRFRVMDEKTSKVHEIDRSFLDCFEYYIPELHDSLGEEINMKQKNYYLPAARMVTDHVSDKFVILVDKISDDEYVVEQRNGETVQLPKNVLFPITKDNADLLYQYVPEDIVPLKYKPGNSFKAKEEISRHYLLNSSFQPGDVITIKKIDTVNTNVLEDTFIVSRSGENEIVLSYADLTNYFDHYANKGMVRQTKAKIEYVNENFDNMLKQFEKDEKEKEINVIFNSVIINGFTFERVGTSGISDYLELKSEFKLEDVESLIEAIRQLDHYFKKQ